MSFYSKLDAFLEWVEIKDKEARDFFCKIKEKVNNFFNKKGSA